MRKNDERPAAAAFALHIKIVLLDNVQLCTSKQKNLFIIPKLSMYHKKKDNLTYEIVDISPTSYLLKVETICQSVFTIFLK